MPVKQLVSAGGVVYRVKNGSVEVIACGRSSPTIWSLPKGTQNPGETCQQTSLREVSEETGLEVEIKQFIDSIDYWFVRSAGGLRYHKVVFFYLMVATGGDVSLHDHEFDTVRWFPVEEVLEVLVYENETRVVQNGLSLVSKKPSA